MRKIRRAPRSRLRATLESRPHSTRARGSLESTRPPRPDEFRLRVKLRQRRPYLHQYLRFLESRDLFGAVAEQIGQDLFGVFADHRSAAIIEIDRVEAHRNSRHHALSDFGVFQ